MKNAQFAFLLLVGCQQKEQQQIESPEDSAQTVDDSGEASDTEEPADEPADEPSSPTDEEPEEIDCPDNTICVNTFPYTHSDSTIGGESNFDYYSCATSTNESGPEIVYQVDIPEDGFLALDLTEMGSGADIDVHLLDSRSANDCIDRGHWSAGAFISAGRYYVVADTWVNSSGVALSGNYTLQMGLTTVQDLQDAGMHSELAFDALYAFDVAWSQGDGSRFEYGITDYTLHSSDPRFWLYDLATGELLWNLHIAHGEASSDYWDEGYADTFSNTPDSHQSSLGMMRGAESYTGAYGYSMRIDGLEPGYNDNVRSRAIVMHGWQGSRPEYVNQYGSVAPTWGCPAVDDREVVDIVDTLSDGALMFFWYPDGNWSEYSSYLP